MSIFLGTIPIGMGKAGLSAYQQAQEGGFSGSEEAFQEALANLPSVEKQSDWDGKASTSYVDSAIQSIQNSIPETAKQEEWDSKATTDYVDTAIRAAIGSVLEGSY